MQNILGLDLSLTGTGIALLTSNPVDTMTKLQGALPSGSKPVVHLGADGRQCIALKVDTSKVDEYVRWKRILDTVLVFERVADHIVIENYSFGSFGHHLSLAELGGIVRFALCEQGRSLHHGTIAFVAPIQVKKFLLGAVKAEKNTMLLKVFQRYGIELPDDNMADAFMLAKIGEALEHGTEGLPQFQVEVIEALKNPKVKTKKAKKSA